MIEVIETFLNMQGAWFVLCAPFIAITIIVIAVEYNQR